MGCVVVFGADSAVLARISAHVRVYALFLRVSKGQIMRSNYDLRDCARGFAWFLVFFGIFEKMSLRGKCESLATEFTEGTEGEL